MGSLPRATLGTIPSWPNPLPKTYSLGVFVFFFFSMDFHDKTLEIGLFFPAQDTNKTS